jgi:hypothetical protein
MYRKNTAEYRGVSAPAEFGRLRRFASLERHQERMPCAIPKLDFFHFWAPAHKEFLANAFSFEMGEGNGRGH